MVKYLVEKNYGIWNWIENNYKSFYATIRDNWVLHEYLVDFLRNFTIAQSKICVNKLL